MWDIRDNKIDDYHIYGIISSNHRGIEVKPYNKLVYNHFQNSGGMIYIYSRENEKKSLEYLEEIWEIKLAHFYNTGRLIFICREDFLIGNNIDSDKFGREIENALALLDRNGAKDKIVYITIDGFWSYFIGDDGQACYDFLKKLNYSGETKFILRYIMEELSEKYIYNLLENHELLLVDGVEDFEVYAPEELMYKSMTLLSRHNFLIYNYEKEMIRVEHLKTLGELMEGTVHDMNNLLITILGYAQLAMITENEEDIEKSLKIIQNTSLDGKIIIDRLKHHIRGSTNSLKTLYEFNDIVKTSIEMTEHKFKPSYFGEKKQIELVVDLKSNRYIYGNEYELRQSIINMILNGVDAMEGSGTMVIKTYDIKEQTILEIKDTGCGMDEFTINNIFNPYFSTKGNKGTGLGLNIAKKVFEKHGGKVCVESKVGEGTKFTIYFPTEEFMSNIAEIESRDYNIN